jgi:hypothetical protein
MTSCQGVFLSLNDLQQSGLVIVLLAMAGLIGTDIIQKARHAHVLRSHNQSSSSGDWLKPQPHRLTSATSGWNQG